MTARAVLFDFALTLLAPEPAADWVTAAAAAAGVTVADPAALGAELERLGRSGGPDPVDLPGPLAELWADRDRSFAAHRAAYTALLARDAALSSAFVRALYDRGTTPNGWVPYADTRGVLAALGERGVRRVVVSNVGFDLRAVFAGHGLDALVDGWALSCELRRVKPEPEIFRAALAVAGVGPAGALMVGDSAASDAGAVGLGISVLLLPPTGPGTVHGLERVLALV